MLVTCPHCQLELEKDCFVKHIINIHELDTTFCPICETKYKISNYFRTHLSNCTKYELETPAPIQADPTPLDYGIPDLEQSFDIAENDSIKPESEYDTLDYVVCNFSIHSFCRL